MNKDVEALIEYQHTIGDARPGQHQPIRFTRGNPGDGLSKRKNLKKPLRESRSYLHYGD